MCLKIAYLIIKKRNLVVINNDTYQRETVSERPIRQPLTVEFGIPTMQIQCEIIPDQDNF